MLAAQFSREAEASGFPVSGAVDLALARDAYSDHVKRYDEWLARGYAGEMAYLARGRDRRADPTIVFPGARAVLCVVEPYPTAPAGAGSPEEGPRYARYLRGGDYHKTIARRLEAVMERLGAVDPSLQWKVCVDTSAVLERAWAALAGLGWIGKNTMLIHPKLGSYLFIGVVLINQETGRAPSPLPDYCGNCSRCLETCPTKAFARERVIDSNRCISYLTLEKRGELAIDEATRRAMGTWVAGCDVCQEVCPFNARRSKAEAGTRPSDDGATVLTGWGALLGETEDEYSSRVRDSALRRVKPDQFRRNLKTAFENASHLQPDKNRAGEAL